MKAQFICSRTVGALLLSLLFILAGCQPTAGTGVIQLSELEPIPTVVSDDIVPLRVAVAAVISPRGTVESYQPLLDYMSDELNRPVELVQRRTYREVNDLIEQGLIDIAFVCTSAYVEGHDQFGMELLAAPQAQGAPVYYSLLIVPATSPARSIEDLRESVFAFTDPISTSGWMYPTYLVLQLGSSPDSFFSRTFFTYSHDDAIRAVANGIADGAAVDNLVYEFAIARNPELEEKTRVIDQSPAFAAPPVVVGPSVRPQLKAELEDFLFNLPNSPEGEEALRALSIERFVPIEDSAYDSVRELAAQIDLLPAEEQADD